ncbi:MAG TPA: serine hydroxymethyltransferase [Candidatus Absconditabacterales bacterium]|nr:serine hydroxymethyltransferase [Candidatus Absconditabacterales bacterium]HMT27026.1 serine hydroxymethyltransferase [Candidatus Absconditabacterales bacterium]
MLKTPDNELNVLLKMEFDRQQDGLEMIASENYVSKPVMESLANVFTNKYSEGYPTNRYYGGQEWVDRLELLTQYRALKAFDLIQQRSPKILELDFTPQAKKILDVNSRGVNVQPLSGSPANLAVYMATLKPRDTVLGMDLSAGGHLSHGHPLNSSGLLYKFVSYGVDPHTHLINYDDILAKALEHKPKMIIAGFSAYSRSIQRKNFYDIVLKVEKKHGYRPLLMADIAHIAGLIAGKAIEGPFKYFDIVTTTTHKTLRGPRGALIFYRKTDEATDTKRLKKSDITSQLQNTIKRNGQEIDLQKAINRGVFPGLQGGPHVNTYVAKALALEECTKADFKKYAENTIKNAKILATSLQELGRTIVSGGTDNHIVLVDVTSKNFKKENPNAPKRGKAQKFIHEQLDTGLTGSIAEKTLDQIGISVNKNMIPFDKRSPLDPSGLRLGTAALTTRDMGKKEVEMIASFIDQALTHFQDMKELASLEKKVKELCKKFPLDY